MHAIAFLATGDELVNGEIINTNTAAMAEILFDSGLNIGNHLICKDQEEELIKSISYLLVNHDILIISGGLGPTSDDRTREALAKAVKRELVFDEPSMAALSKRLQRASLKVSENNRKQAFFPRGSIVIPNYNGTAAGCQLMIDTKIIFMLPGPPLELMPMFHNKVLPVLLELLPQRQSIFKKWRVFGVSEGQIAERIEKLVKPFNCITGYRLHRPYLDCKIHIYDVKKVKAITAAISKILAPYIICPPDSTASALLATYAAKLSRPLIICDKATKGELQATIIRPNNYKNLLFINKSKIINNDVLVKIEGLTEYWHQCDNSTTSIKIQIEDGKTNDQYSYQLRLQQRYTLTYAVELISSILFKFCKKHLIKHTPNTKP